MKACILVIEDETRIRRNIATILRMEGYETLEAENGRLGVELARKHLPDLIICDILMPELNGLATLEELRNEPATARIPFIFLTSRSDREDIRKGMIHGADDYLCKPFETSELLETLEARLKRVSQLSGAGAKAEPAPEMLAELGLTNRECETLFWVSQGKSNADICIILGIKLTTIKKHLESIYLKLGVENRTAAAAMALEVLNR